MDNSITNWDGHNAVVLLHVIEKMIVHNHFLGNRMDGFLCNDSRSTQMYA